MQQLSQEAAAWIAGALVSILGAMFAHKAKFIPFSISFDKKKTDNFVTCEQLAKNCESRQHSLDKRLEKIGTSLDSVSSKIDKQYNLIMANRIDLGDRISRLEGIVK